METTVDYIFKKCESLEMRMVNILVIEDDESLSKLYEIVLHKEGYGVYNAKNGREAFEIIENKHIDLVMTDIMMPVMDGYEFIGMLREQDSRIPVLIVTAKDDYLSKNTGFTLGTDDYMVKPVDLDEMVLRIRALLRRANVMAERKLMVGDTTLDYDAFTVDNGEECSMLPQKEFLLLYRLLSTPNKIFTRFQLMDEIWGRDSKSDPQTIDVHINRLRKRFQDNKDFTIVTVRGLGFKAVITE